MSLRRPVELSNRGGASYLFFPPFFWLCIIFYFKAVLLKMMSVLHTKQALVCSRHNFP